jgi:hypothetical protein
MKRCCVVPHLFGAVEKGMEDERDVRASHSFPELFPITLSHSEFPCSGFCSPLQTLVANLPLLSEAMKFDSGMTFGITVTPFLPHSDGTNLYLSYLLLFLKLDFRKKDLPKITSASKVARCMNCAAYLNPFCEATTVKWICSLCGTRNVFPKSMVSHERDLSDLFHTNL